MSAAKCSRFIWILITIAAYTIAVASTCLLMRSRFEPLTSPPVGRGKKAMVNFTKGRAVERNSWIRYCVIQITEPSKVEHRQAARFQPAVSSGYTGTGWLYVNSVGMNAHVMFKALEEAKLNGCDGDWFFMAMMTRCFTRGGSRRG